MLKLIHRRLFFTVPSLAGLSESDRASKLQELQSLYNLQFNKEQQQQIRDSKSSLTPEQLEKIDLIHDHILRLNTYETIALRKSVQSASKPEYDWPIFPRPESQTYQIPAGLEVAGVGKVASTFDLISKLTLHGVVEKIVEEVKVVENEKASEKSSYNLVLVGFDPSAKVKFIKTIKDILGLGLKESKEKVEEVAKGPVVLFKSVSKESHGKIHEALLAAGGQVEFQ